MSALSFSLFIIIRSNYHQAYFCSILFFIHNHTFKLSSSLCPLYPFLYQYVQIIIKLMSALSFSLSTHSSFYQAYISSILFFINTFKFSSSLFQPYPYLYYYHHVDSAAGCRRPCHVWRHGDLDLVESDRLRCSCDGLLLC